MVHLRLYLAALVVAVAFPVAVAHAGRLPDPLVNIPAKPGVCVGSLKKCGFRAPKGVTFGCYFWVSRDQQSFVEHCVVLRRSRPAAKPKPGLAQ